MRDALTALSSQAGPERLYEAAAMTLMTAQNLEGQGKDDAAVIEYARALELAQASAKPDALAICPFIAHGYGLLLQRLGRYEEADAVLGLVGTFARASGSGHTLDIAMLAAAARGR